jgi:four helix bundle protein
VILNTLRVACGSLRGDGMGEGDCSTRNLDHAHGRNIRNRALLFAGRVVALCEDLMAEGGAGRQMSPQLINAATSGHANLEEAQSGESDADFISKLCIALKEFREAHGRLQVLQLRKIGPVAEVAALCDEANQIIAIIVTIIANKRRSSELRANRGRPMRQRRRTRDS